ncbi:MAG: glycosyltransferase family 2 protein [Lutimonas sp.]
MITAVIPTLNEEDFIAEAIRRVSFADEILVIDSFSSDKTVEVARDAGAKVVQRKFDDFSTQKNFAIRQATHEWILVIDADERVSDELGEEIVESVAQPGDRVAFFLYRNFYFKEKRVYYGGWQTDKAIRLFKKGSGRYNGNLVHETIDADGPVGYLKNRLDHYSYRNREQYADKLEMYARLQAEELYRKNKKSRFWLLTFKPAFRFFVHYIVRMGILDGTAGYELARAHAIGVWKRYKYLGQRHSESGDAEVYMKPKL